MKLSLPFVLIFLSLNLQAKVEKAHANQKSWGGFWWSMKNAELALGWQGQYNRAQFSPADIQEFSNCLTSKSRSCKSLLDKYSKNNAISLSPLMKFDLFMKRYIEKNYGSDVPAYYYSKSAQKELEIHYINNDPNHRHYKSRGFAGKCIGWALSNFDYNEPTKVKTIEGIDFTPADIKGILAAIYNGAQFFIPNSLVIGTEYRSQGKRSKAYKDVTPLQFLDGLRRTIKKGKFLEADLDPGFGVWNYPIHSYELKYDQNQNKPTEVLAEITIEFANDEVSIDDVFSTKRIRKDMKKRTYTASFKVPSKWDGKLEKATSSKWTGASINNHPDAIILGLEEGWRETILEYEDTKMATEVNYELIKSHDGFTSVVDELLAEYFSN